ncbi:MAG: toxin [Candidatus Omnitrophota bacterium]|nr:MAG: toxin [Candidatus Omnitrophota bacterium]
MKQLTWNLLKSARLRKVRGVSFEEIINSKLIAVKKHPSREGQNIMLFEHKRYIWVVPYVEDEDTIFLKTLYPNRKYTKLYKEGKLNEKD